MNGEKKREKNDTPNVRIIRENKLIVNVECFRIHEFLLIRHFINYVAKF